MDFSKIIKAFPLLPTENDTTKLFWAIVFYALAPTYAGMMVGYMLCFTIILMPVGVLLMMVTPVYIYTGLIFSVLKYLGKEIK